MAAAIAEFFGALAVMLSAMGVGGLVAYGVSRRVKEIAIRIALGADRSRIVRSVLAQGVIVTVIGAAVGLVAGVGSSQWIHALLVGVSSSDPVVVIWLPAGLLNAAGNAGVQPADRAAPVGPPGGLRTE
jgi:ABC-type antimicrobial peptide transport system permease subunit